jgi:hypothetical protein
MTRRLNELLVLLLLGLSIAIAPLACGSSNSGDAGTDTMTPA